MNNTEKKENKTEWKAWDKKLGRGEDKAKMTEASQEAEEKGSVDRLPDTRWQVNQE